MAFSPLEGDLNYVESLPDQPSLSGGYSPAELKRVFDRAPQEIRAYLNETLLKELESCALGRSGAEQIGSAEANGIPAGTLHQQILALKALSDAWERDFHTAVSGLFPPNSILFDRLDPQTQAKILSGANKDCAVYYKTTPGTDLFTAPKTGTYRIRLCGGGAAGTYASPLFAETDELTNNQSYFGFGGASASALETYLDLEAGDSFPITVGAGADPADAGFSPSAQSGITPEVMLDYLQSAAYRTVGGETLFGSDAHPVFLRCPGGDCSRGATLPDFGDYSAYPVLSRSGRAPRASIQLLSGAQSGRFYADPAGEDSALGRGGNTDGQTARQPGPGGGGMGGSLRFSQGCFYPETEPGAGAGGLVLIDYLT